MNFSKKIRAITIDTLNNLDAANSEIKRLEKEREKYYKPTFEQLWKEAQNRRDAVIAEGRKKIEWEISDFKKSVRQRYTPKGAELTEDAALLNSGITLTRADLETLWDKHSGNITMQRLLSEYAESHKIIIGRTYFSEESKMDAADTMRQYFNNAMQRPEYGDVWRNEEWFTKVTPEAIREE